MVIIGMMNYHNMNNRSMIILLSVALVVVNAVEETGLTPGPRESFGDMYLIHAPPLGSKSVEDIWNYWTKTLEGELSKT